MPNLFIKYKGNQPYQYRYGEDIEATILMVEGGYPTEEEAIAAYERSLKNGGTHATD